MGVEMSMKMSMEMNMEMREKVVVIVTNMVIWVRATLTVYWCVQVLSALPYPTPLLLFRDVIVTVTTTVTKAAVVVALVIVVVVVGMVLIQILQEAWAWV
jgi:hypothetical protein